MRERIKDCASKVTNCADEGDVESDVEEIEDSSRKGVGGRRRRSDRADGSMRGDY